MLKKIFENLKGFVKRGVESYMKNEEIKAKALVEVCNIGADLVKTTGRGIHATIHEIIDGIGNIVNTSTKNKKNSLMTACIFGGLSVGVVLAYIINANMVEKNERIIATE